MGQLPPCLIRHCSHAKNAPARDLASLAGEPSLFAASAAAKLERLQAGLAPLAGRYDAVVANPPYMGAKNMNAWLGGWVKKRYPDVKGDLFSCFMVRNSRMGAEHAQLRFMTPYVWMFIGTYEKLREFVVKKNTITSLTQLEYSGFSGATVPICAFTLQKGLCPGYKGGYIRLSDFVGADQQGPRALQALADPDCGWFYRADAMKFGAIPGSPVAYWASEAMRRAFLDGSPLSVQSIARDGIHTCDNDRFLRRWWEVSHKSSSLPPRGRLDAKWYAYNKGGAYRKWYGNNEYVINWADNGQELRSSPKAHGFNGTFAFRPSVTWSSISSGKPAFRQKSEGFMFDAAGYSMFDTSTVTRELLCGFANSTIAESMLSFLSPTLNYQAGDIMSMPLVDLNEINAVSIEQTVVECGHLSQVDWDTQETSWDFKRNPLV